MIDFKHPFYRPLWRRIAIVATTLGWTAFELLVTRNGFWLAIAGGLCALTGWYLLIRWKEPPPSSPA